MPETLMPDMGVDEQGQLVQARRENAQRSIEQAEQMLSQATDPDQRAIWENRLAQRRAELEGFEQEQAA